MKLRMTLRQKTLLTIALTLVSLNAVLYSISSTILLRNSLQAEEENGRQAITAAHRIFSQNLKLYLDEFENRFKDWSAWNDTYEFIANKNQDYIQSNLIPESLTSIRANLVLYIDLSGNIIFGTGFDPSKAQKTPISESLRKHLLEGDLLIERYSPETRTGIFSLPEGIMMLTAQPILTSKETGPARGTVIFGRYLADAEIRRLASNSSLMAYRYYAKDLPPDVKAIQPKISEVQPTYLTALSEKALAGYALIQDLYGQPALLLKLEIPRENYRKSRESLIYLMAILTFAVGFVFGIVTLFLLEKLVLWRLARLSIEVTQIGSKGDLSVRVSMPGSDELSRLTTSINEMLIALDRQAQEQKRAEMALRFEKEKSERLLLNILPKEIADRLKESRDAIAENFSEVTILFADVVGFTPLSARLQPIELVNLLNEMFSTFDQLADQYGLEKIKTIGDAYMVAGGLPVPREDHAEAVAEMALDMQQAIEQLRLRKGESFQIRIGINTGQVVAGVIGTKKFSYDLWGDTVNVASRMESSGVPGKIQVTTSTYEKLRHQYVLEARGTVTIKGKGDMITYWLAGRKEGPG